MHRSPASFGQRLTAGLTAVAFIGAQLALPARAQATGLGSSTASAGSVPPPGVTTIQSFQPDLFTGRATTSVPITVPPGRRGLQPALALSYSSSGRNGWVGVGWMLELGYIERSTKRGVPAYTAADTYSFMVQGVASDLVQTPDGFYRAKDEGLFFRFQQTAGGWEARDKAGSRYLFGQSSASQIVDAGRVFRWALEKIIDTHGNTLTVTYTKDQNQLYPAQIDYTGHEPSGLAPANKVVFTLESRSDTDVSYRSGFRTATARRLKQIETFAKRDGVEQRAARYTLAYDTSSQTSRPLLRSVTMAGTDGATTLPTTSFFYQDNAGFYSLKSLTGTVPVEDVSWNAQVAAHDLQHEVFSCGSTPTHPYAGLNWGSAFKVPPSRSEGCTYVSAGANGALSLNSCQDRYVHAWTWIYLNSPRSLSLSSNGFCVWTETADGVAFQPNPGNVALPQGWSILHLTAHHEHAGFSASQTADLTAQTDLISPTQTSFIEPQLAGDFNGDGIADVAVFKQSPTPGTWKVSPGSRGDDFRFDSTWLTNFGGAQAVPYVGDWNADGFTDIAVLESGLWRAALSDGRRFTAAPSLNTTPPSGHTLLAGDFNGDGLTDLGGYKASTGQFAVAIGTGTGFGAFQSWLASDSAWQDRQPLTGDFNGDGLTDVGTFAGASGTVRVAVSNGTGFTRQPVAWLSGFAVGATVTPADFNGDGLTDLGYLDTGSGFIRYTPAATNGFGYTRTVSIAFSLLDATTGIQVADFNGDGIGDPAVFSAQTNSAELAYSHGTNVDLLYWIMNGLGGETTITYAPSTGLDNKDATGLAQLPFAIPVVASVRATDKRGSFYTTGYTYQGGKYDTTAREFAGFASVTVTDAGGTRTVADFIQTSPTKGRISRQRVLDTFGNLFSEQENAWSCRSPASGVDFCPLSRQISRTYDGDATFKETATSFTYDDYGNPLTVVEEGEPLVGGDERATVNTYALNTAAWLVGAPATSTVHDGSDGTAPIVSQRRLYYDNAAAHTTPPATGNLTKEEVWRNLPTVKWLPTTMTYDAYGNVLTVKDALNRQTANTYDAATHTYLETVTNAAGHVRQMTYDPRFGVVTSATDANGQTTTTEYDALGRVSKVIGPADTAALPTISYTYALASPLSKTSVAARIQSGQAATLTTDTYTDGLGRTIQVRSPAEQAGKQVVGGVVAFDSRGRVSKQWLPYLSNAASAFVPVSSEPGGGASLAFATYTYDAVGRALTTTEADGSTTATAYDDWTVTVTNAKGQQSRRINDSFGRLAEVHEFNAADTYITRYAYDARNSLIQVTDAAGNVTAMQYDSLGRKLAMNDPDMGVWTYAYDDVGNLAGQTDARGVTTTFTYDSLNRLKTKTYAVPGGSGIPAAAVVTYTYDEPAATFSRGKLTTIVDGSGTSQFDYDALGRMNRERKTIDGITYTIQRAYDLLGRLTALTYPDNDVASYTYNAQGGIETISLQPAGGSLQPIVSDIAYNAAGQLTRMTYGTGVTTDYSYDPQTLRLSSLRTANSALQTLQDFSYTFDAIGNVQSITDGAHSGSQSFEYDDLNRLTQASGASYGTLTYRYDAIGNMIEKEGVTLTYGLADGSKPHAVTRYGDVSITYDANGNQRTKGDAAYTFDAENRLARAAGPAGGGVETAAFAFSQGWNFFALPVIPEDASIDSLLAPIRGCFTQISRFNATTQTFEHYVGDARYDQFTALDYLRGYQIYVTAEDGCSLAVTGTLPATAPSVNLKTNWNLTGTAAQDDTAAVSEALAPLASGADYTRVAKFDALTDAYEELPGSLASIEASNGVFLKAAGTRTWTLPPLVARPSNTTDFVYDGDGGRVKLITPQGSTKFLGQSVEIAPDGTVTQSLFAGSQRIATKTSSGILRFYHGDHLGSSNVITDGSGALAELAEYTPYGSLSRREGTVEVPQKFTGQRLDSSTGLYFYHARYYDPQLGRFISADPLTQSPGDPQTFNHYAYARNNPLIYTDPGGHFIEWLIALVISVVISVATEAIIKWADLSGSAAKFLRALGAAASTFFGGGITGMTPLAQKVTTAAAAGSSLLLDTGEGRQALKTISRGLEDFGVSPRASAIIASVAANIAVRTSLELAIPTLLGKASLTEHLGRAVDTNNPRDVALQNDILQNGETFNFKTPGQVPENTRFVLDDSGNEIGIFGYNDAGSCYAGCGIHYDLIVKKDLAGIRGTQLNPPKLSSGYALSSTISHQRVSMTMLEAGYRTNAFLLGGANWSTLVSAPIAGIYGGGLYNSVYIGTSEGQRRQ